VYMGDGDDVTIVKYGVGPNHDEAS
jgi:hypothetical protein